MKTLEIGLCEDFDGEGCRVKELIENRLSECKSYSNEKCNRYHTERNIEIDRFGRFYVKLPYIN